MTGCTICIINVNGHFSCEMYFERELPLSQFDTVWRPRHPILQGWGFQKSEVVHATEAESVPGAPVWVQMMFKNFAGPQRPSHM